MPEVDPRYRRLIPGTPEFANAQRLDLILAQPQRAYPRFNQAAWEQAVQGMLPSSNIEDRRPDMIPATLQASLIAQALNPFGRGPSTLADLAKFLPRR